MQISESDIDGIIRLHTNAKPLDYDDYDCGVKLATGHILREIKRLEEEGA